MKREDDYLTRRTKLSGLSDGELNKYFWELANKIVNPLIDLASRNTSPSIERSVLLRMGFNSIEAKAIVDECVRCDLLGKGSGHIVLKFAKHKGIEFKKAGKLLASGKGWYDVMALFERKD